MWKFWIDTGGTFTDCIGISPEGEFKRIKLLSNGRIRGLITTVISKTELIVSLGETGAWGVLTGYSFRILGSADSRPIAEIDEKSSVIRIESPVSSIREGDSFEISSDEEVPVLAVRLITGTGLQEELPPMELRLGSTKGTNALLERKGARTLLVTSKGFRDILRIGNQQRPNLFELNIRQPEMLFSDVIEAEGRLDKDGKKLTEVNGADIEKKLARLPPFDSAAIALLHSYKDSVQEDYYEAQLRELGCKFISRSSAISRDIHYGDRTSTTLVNAYLDPIISRYVDGIGDMVKSPVLMMSSAGGLMAADEFLPKDSLLSGPAGGVLGAVHVARESGEDRIISFDMGGTSTDVALYNGSFDYQYVTRVGDARIQSPSLAIETVAAGGGSVCSYDGFKISAGPDSMGANPGPACYGVGGELTITDVNLLLGRLVIEQFQIPLHKDAAERKLTEFHKQLDSLSTREEILESILLIANEKMSAAIGKISIKKGLDPEEFTLVAFGGAGGQHACSLATILNMRKILVPYDAGLLSAKGIGVAERQKVLSRQVLRKIDEVDVGSEFSSLIDEAKRALSNGNSYTRSKLAYMRFMGQEDTIEVLVDTGDLLHCFEEEYRRIYGHWIQNKAIEIESLKVIVAVPTSPVTSKTEKRVSEYKPVPMSRQQSFFSGWQDVPVFRWEGLEAGAVIDGPALVVSNNSTLVIEPDWQARLNESNTFILTGSGQQNRSEGMSSEATLELFTNRFYSIVEDMGAALQRTSFSVNIRERLDFSCGLLDRDGDLIVNAPHIPVHLGSLGMCVRSVLEEMPLGEGDVVITNHPKYGGSHLPDVTLIAPVFFDNERVGFVANRAHHAEIGGRTPGSMPADADSLQEEGVIIEPQYLVKGGIVNWKGLTEVLAGGKFATRAVEENIADLTGALASIRVGVDKLKNQCGLYGINSIVENMESLKNYAADLMRKKLLPVDLSACKATELLDDGSKLSVSVDRKGNSVNFDFTGTGPQHPGNLNATPAIVNSVVLYCLRVLLDRDLPLNEGLIRDIKIINPPSLLNPDFGNLERLPAVVGGNTEVSQRLTDTILKALRLAACSQGTMNNFLFGNDRFAYYETICGGVGAGDGFNGASAVHQHMTNTRITDPEILELRFPVRLHRFEIRQGSGGPGKYKGGDGVIREMEFLLPLTYTLLSQHRIQKPYGLNGGQEGSSGRQQVVRANGEVLEIEGISTGKLGKGDRVIIMTPGGGGFGNE